MRKLAYTETPVEPLDDPRFREAGVRVFVKREDRNHAHVSGNKWWKLKYNLEEAQRLKKRCVLTFGGAYSNHIYATAAAASELQLESIGIIRGDERLPLNPTLAFASERGMQLHYLSRSRYRNKSDAQTAEQLRDGFGDFYLIPEGGTNNQGIRGCAEFAREHLAMLEFDYLFLPVGTGGTMAGIIHGLKGEKEIRGVAVLKCTDNFLARDVERLLSAHTGRSWRRWSVLTDYHHGGYAKVTNDLLRFADEVRQRHGLPVDNVYNAKALWGLYSEIAAGRVARGSTVLYLHTGGLQGSFR